jgi:hypothetical protein
MSKSLARARSIQQLRKLNFDPMEKLVKVYGELESEVEKQHEIRSGNRVELTHTGRPRAYRPEVHHALYDKMINIGNNLLRYGYARLPETTVLEEVAPAPLTINLTKKDENGKEVYTINSESSDE